MLIQQIKETEASITSAKEALKALESAIGPIMAAPKDSVYPKGEPLPEGSSEATKLMKELDYSIFLLRLDIESLTSRIQL
jgi:hypothetical protein